MGTQMNIYHPVISPVSQFFGKARTSEDLLEAYKKYGLKGHNGIDYACNEGTTIRAAHDGDVVYSGLDGANGLLVTLRSSDKTYKTVYGHCSRSLVKAGDVVECGQAIAISGNTGASTGPHLHFGLKPIQQGEADWVWFNTEQDNGYNGAIDPLPHIVGYAEHQFRLKSLLRQAILTAKEIISNL